MTLHPNRRQAFQALAALTTLAAADSTGNGLFTNSRGDNDEWSFGAQMEIWW